MKHFETAFENYMVSVCQENPDPSHDILHIKRVVSIAKKLAHQEKANLQIIIPAAYLHDCVYISKTDERRNQASQLSADRALEILTQLNYQKQLLPAIHHAIAAHSFSAKITAKSLEAKIVQDADRLDAMGATGIFRCFVFSGLAKRPLCSANDPFCHDRSPNDSDNTLDHFFTKLLHLQDKLNTSAAQAEGAVRLQAMNSYLDSLKRELTFN